MATAKDLIVKPISQKDAARLVKRIHYSGKIAMTSQLHFGVFLNGILEGAMQFGSSIDKRKTQRLVKDTGWNEFIELNRMAFSDRLPRNSESRALGVAFRLIRKYYPHIKWIISFADGCQCGDGTIYRASGFTLTGIKKNTTMLRTPDGEVVTDKTFNRNVVKKYKGFTKSDCDKLKGFQIRYVYFIDKSYKDKLTVPVLPFSKIDELGVSMYKGKKIKRTKEQDIGYPPILDGALPIRALHSQRGSE